MSAQVQQRWIEKINVLCQKQEWVYAQFLCMELLHGEPNLVEVRKILQQIRPLTAPKSKIYCFTRLFVTFTYALWCLLNFKKKHRELLVSLDQLLNLAPNNLFLLRLVAEVMASFQFYETAIFTIECIDEQRRNRDDWLLMGEALVGAEAFQQAVNIANEVLLKAPNDTRARDLLWQASVEQSMKSETVL